MTSQRSHWPSQGIRRYYFRDVPQSASEGSLALSEPGSFAVFTFHDPNSRYSKIQQYVVIKTAMKDDPLKASWDLGTNCKPTKTMLGHMINASGSGDRRHGCEFNLADGKSDWYGKDWNENELTYDVVGEPYDETKAKELQREYFPDTVKGFTEQEYLSTLNS